jgi:hypothetical protein
VDKHERQSADSFVDEGYLLSVADGEPFDRERLRIGIPVLLGY